MFGTKLIFFGTKLIFFGTNWKYFDIYKFQYFWYKIQ